MKVLLYLKTIRYLKFEQIFYRILYKIKKIKIRDKSKIKISKISSITNFPSPSTKSFLGDNNFKFLNIQRTLKDSSDWNNKDWGKLYLYNLHYFDYLRQEEMRGEVGQKYIERWIEENPIGIGNGWEPYTLSLRIVNWIKWQLEGNILTEQAILSLAIQVRFLMKKIERHLLANHFLANAKALVFAGLFFDGEESEKFLQTGCKIYERELKEQILNDGGHFELSAMYHSIILEDLLDLVNINAPLELKKIIEKMLFFLSAMTHPNGNIALFNDAANKIALSPKQLWEYAIKLKITTPSKIEPNVLLADSGYARLSKGEWTLFCDGANLGADYQLGHAHADTLSFELFYAKEQIIINSGTGEYIDTPLRKEQRGTAGHNCLMIDNKNSSEVWGAHRVAKRAKIIDRTFSKDMFYAQHNGYLPIKHGRTFSFEKDKVKIVDQVDGKGKCKVKVFWHFNSNCNLEIEKNRIKISQNDNLFFLSTPNDWSVEIKTGNYSPEFGKTLSHKIIVFSKEKKLPIYLESYIGKLKI